MLSFKCCKGEDCNSVVYRQELLIMIKLCKVTRKTRLRFPISIDLVVKQGV